MTETQILDIFKKSEALLTGHFLLTSGRHSDKYFQCAKVLQYPEHTEKLCGMIVDRFKDAEIDTVISPAIGGLVVGQEVARQLNKRFIFAERENNSLTLRRGFSLGKNEIVLICEDVVTTGGSVFEVIDIVKRRSAEVVGVGFIVDRSNGKVKFGPPQISSLQMNVISFSPEDCPMCKSGSIPIKPGSRKM
jgi:orotate phosphoribosyltransferase